MTLHVAGLPHSPNSTDAVFPDAFRPWRAQLIRDGVPPVIAVAGSRGKSTVVGLLERMFREAGLSCATKTNRGMAIRGVLQANDESWTQIKTKLYDNQFDIAVEELSWDDVASQTSAHNLFAVTAITNICSNRDECLIQDDSRRAVASLPYLIAATADSGALVLSSEDLAVIGPDLDHDKTTIFVGQNMDNPVIQFHLESGGACAWRSGSDEVGTLYCGALGSSNEFGDVSAYEFMLRGAAAFQITNALTAIAAAASCGVPVDAIRRALHSFDVAQPDGDLSFRVVDSHGVRIVIDRPNPSWHLRQVVRSLRDTRSPRVIAVIGKFDSTPSNDLIEVGRLLGRLSSVLIVHSSPEDEAQVTLLRQGVAQNPTPSVIVHTQSEKRAIEIALDRSRRDDLIFVMTDDESIAEDALADHQWTPFNHAPEAASVASI